MAKYSASNGPVSGQQALTTTAKTQLALTSPATVRRGKLYEMDWGQSAAPNATDCDIIYDVVRQTAAGTSTAFVPAALDPADAAALTVGAVNFTAEGTLTGNALWIKAVNQRNSATWQASPGSEIVWPATNLAGLALRAYSPTYVGTVMVGTMFEEQ